MKRPQAIAALLALVAILTLPGAASAQAAGIRAAATVRLPPTGPFDYQLGGVYPPPRGTVTVARDRTDAAARGLYNICYVNGFQTQTEDLPWWRARHRNLLLVKGGREVVDQDWGETLLDTSTSAKRQALAGVIGSWIDGCAARGFQGVEFDNLDSYTRSEGLLSRGDNFSLAVLLVREAHKRGLAAGQKNTADATVEGRRIGYDFAIAEECAVYSECGSYTRVYGREVLEIEYSDNGLATFAAACRAAGGRRPVILRDRDLVTKQEGAYVYRRC